MLCVADAIACLRFAREHEILVSVRGGGHIVAGKFVCEGGLMIDLSAMKGTRVDPARRTVRTETGFKLGEFDRETQAFGLSHDSRSGARHRHIWSDPIGMVWVADDSAHLQTVG